MPDASEPRSFKDITKHERAVILDAALSRHSTGEVEAHLLGSLLANARAYESVSSFLRPEHFSDPIYAAVYECYVQEVERGRRADAITLRVPLAAMLSGMEAEEDAGAILTQCLVAMVTPAAAPSYGTMIVEGWQRRQAAVAAMQLLLDAGEGASPRSFLMDTVERLDSLRVGGTEGKAGFRSLAEVVATAAQDASDARQRGRPGVTTGIPDLDRLMGGLQSGRLIYLGARPGMGKSALLQSIARAAAPHGVAAFHLEMDQLMLGQREIASATGYDTEHLAEGNLPQDAWDRMVELQRELDGLPVFIMDRPAMSVAEIRAETVRLLRKTRVKLLMVDHVHLMRPPKELARASRVEQLEAISAGLKALAKETGACVLAAAQLSREVDKRDDKRPILSDLRASGGLEQDADHVLFLYREGYYLERERREAEEAMRSDPTHPGHKAAMKLRSEWGRERAELILAKNRGGRLATVPLLWDGPSTTFRPA